MIKKITLSVLFCLFFSGTSFGQRVPIFFYANDRLHSDERTPHDNNKALMAFNSAENNIRYFTNSYFFCNRGALSKKNVDSLNKYLYNQNQFDFLQSASLQNFGTGRLFINAEFFSACFGPVRVGLGGSFQTTGDTMKDNTVKSDIRKIMSNGGTLSINGLFPLLFLRNSSDAEHLGIFAQHSFGLIPGDTTGGTAFPGNNPFFTGQTGLLLHMDAGSSNDKNVSIRLFSDVSFNYVYGNYNSTLGLADFAILNLKAGCVVGDLFTFNVSGPLFSSSNKAQALPFQVAVQFSPSQIAQSSSNGNKTAESDAPTHVDDN